MAKKPARTAPTRAPFDYGPFAVAAAAVIAFLPALSGGFVWDDFDYVKNNPILHATGGAMLARLTSLVVVGNYHPLTMASFVIDNALAGPGPLVFHVTNVILHAANAVLLGWLLSALGARRDAAWAGALLWAVHPLRVESVAWISGRKDVLSTFFFLWAGLLYLRRARDGGAARRSYVYSLLLFACAVLSKATAVAFVPVASLFDWFANRPVTRKTLLEKTPFVALALGAGWMAIRAQATAGALPLGEEANLPGRVAIACYGLAFYVVKTVAPWGLSALYPYPSPAGTLPKGSIAAVLAVALGGILLIWLGRKARFPVFAAGFYLATVALVLQLFPVGGAVAADRYAYLPAAGFSIAIAFAIGRAPLRRGLIAVLLAAAVGLAGATWVRCAAWHDAMSLWNDVLAKHPDAALAHQNRGVAFAAMGDHRAAIADYDAALTVNPRYADALANRGGSKADLGELDGALTDLEEAIRIDPGRATYRFNLGLVLGDLGRWDEALASLTEAIRLQNRS